MKYDTTLLEVLREQCDAIVAAQESGDRAALGDAELQLTVTAMMLCGYRVTEDGYARPKD